MADNFCCIVNKLRYHSVEQNCTSTRINPRTTIIFLEHPEHDLILSNDAISVVCYRQNAVQIFIIKALMKNG